MIESILFKKVGNHFNWLPDLPFFERESVEFKEGLNIIIGPTGSGKSTLLDMLANYMAAKQGGVSTITENWLRKNFDYSITDKNLGSNDEEFQLIHDGQPVLYANPRDTVGIAGGQVDYDFTVQGLLNSMDHGSSGQKSIARTNRCYEAVLYELNKEKIEAAKEKKRIAEEARKNSSTFIGRTTRSLSRERQVPESYPEPFPTEIDWRSSISRNSLNDIWTQKYDIAQQMLSPKIEKGQRTMLMDEPDSGLSIMYQHFFWKDVVGKAKKAGFQVIVVSHSVFALGLDANYIETEEGYLKQCKKILKIK